MSNIWFTSDHHFGHINVMKYMHRPWVDITDMNQALINNWNSLIKPNDIVYYLGDFTLSTQPNQLEVWLSQLNGKLHLVKGNHDKWTKKLSKIPSSTKIIWVKDYHELSLSIGSEKVRIILCHFPILRWNKAHYGSYHLHGHSHGFIQDLNKSVRRLDVGVDCNNYYPILLDNVLSKLNQIPVIIKQKQID